MWRRQRGQFGWEECFSKLVLQSVQTRLGGWSPSEGCNFFQHEVILKQMGHSSRYSTMGGRDEFWRGKTIRKDKQFPISKISRWINSFVIEVVWGI